MPPTNAVSSCDSYCGIYCGACDIRLAGESGHRTRFAAFWTAETIRAARAARGLEPREGDSLELRCGGCKSDFVFVNCKDCTIRECAVERKLAHCSDCPDYPCAMLQGWKKLQAVLPHLRACGPNLETIRSAGVDRWVAEQDAQWRCPRCGGRIAWYSEVCAACGADVRERTFRLSRVKAFLVKVALRFASRRASREASRGAGRRP